MLNPINLRMLQSRYNAHIFRRFFCYGKNLAVSYLGAVSNGDVMETDIQAYNRVVYHWVLFTVRM